MDKINFNEIVKAHSKKNHILKDAILAFIGGGLIGIIGQGLIELYNLYFTLELSYSLSSITFVLISAVLTGIGYYNNLGQIFGAGLFIPITGFSNSMVSSSIEGKSEGLIFGIGSRIFSLAGSVIVYGVLSSIICCSIRYLLMLVGVSL